MPLKHSAQLKAEIDNQRRAIGQLLNLIDVHPMSLAERRAHLRLSHLQNRMTGMLDLLETLSSCSCTFGCYNCREVPKAARVELPFAEVYDAASDLGLVPLVLATDTAAKQLVVVDLERSEAGEGCVYFEAFKGTTASLDGAAMFEPEEVELCSRRDELFIYGRGRTAGVSRTLAEALAVERETGCVAGSDRVVPGNDLSELLRLERQRRLSQTIKRRMAEVA